MTKPFINQFKVFNEYTENQKSMQSQSFQQNMSFNRKPISENRASKHMKSAGGQLHGISEDGPDESSRAESDIQQLEILFKKVQMQYGIDKMQLLKSLLDSGPNSNSGSRGKHKNILAGLTRDGI